jgi:hypothetical protein
MSPPPLEGRGAPAAIAKESVSAVHTPRKTAEYLSDSKASTPVVMKIDSATELVSHTLNEMATVRPSAPSLAQAVEHLTTGEIPKIERQAALAFSDEEPPREVAPVRPRASGMVPGFMLGVVVMGLAAFGFYFMRKPSKQPTPMEAGSVVVIDSTAVAALGGANMAMQQDSHEGRRYAEQAFRKALVAAGSTASEQIIGVSARLGLAQLNLDRAQNALILKKSTSAHLLSAKEWLDAITPTAGQSDRKRVLMARLHRISGRFGSARDALKSVSAEKSGPLYLVETVLLSAPTADVDAAGRVRALESLDAVTLAMPTVWAVRTQAAIALGRLEAARSLVLGAPKGTVRAQFLTILKHHIKKKKVVKDK